MLFHGTLFDSMVGIQNGKKTSLDRASYASGSSKTFALIMQSCTPGPDRNFFHRLISESEIIIMSWIRLSCSVEPCKWHRRRLNLMEV